MSSSSSDPTVAAAAALKDKGNAAFGAGNVDACVAFYKEGIALLKVEAGPAGNTMLATLHSNSANAHLTAERWRDASESAAAAIAVLEGNAAAAAASDVALLDKARFRRARAEHAQGFAFSALCELLLITAPSAEVAALRAKVAPEVGLMGLDGAFGIERFHGGFTAVAREDIPADTPIFAEGQLLVGVEATLGEMPEGVGLPPTTESRVAAFSRELLRLRASEREAERATYTKIVREMKGSWPRVTEDVPAAVLDSVKDITQHIFAGRPEAAAALDAPSATGAPEVATVRDEVLLVSLQARYNCFHRGFFRACALMNHACDANAAMKYQPGRSLALASHRESTESSVAMGVVTLVACRRIAKGEPITVKYLNDNDFILGVVPRRELLLSSWLFTCECRRCVADMAPDAAWEWLRCTATPGCPGYVHLPVAPAEGGTELSEAAMAVTRACPACGLACSVSQDLCEELHDVRRGSMQIPYDAQDQTTGAIDTKVLFDGTLRLRRTVATRCHAQHWLHTLCLYQYCVAAQRRVEQVFSEVAASYGSDQKRALAAASAEFGLERFTNPKTLICDPADKVDGMALFLELEARLKPFYPDAQLWALHVAVGRLAVMLAMCHPDRFATAAPVIMAKAPHFPPNMRPAILGLLKGAGLAPKQLKTLGRAL